MVTILDLDAKHIIGGDVLYECIRIDTVNNKAFLHLEFQMYRDGRDPSGASFDGDPDATTGTSGALFGVFKKVGLRWEFVKSLTVDLALKEPVPANTQPCLISPPAILVERGVYLFDLELDIIDTDYMIAYQRCCRSRSISNLIEPANLGAVFAIEITPEALKTCNNSPVYNEFPPLVICAGFLLEYDHSASDAEGDSIVYSLCTPWSAGGNTEVLGQGPPGDCGRRIIPDPALCGPDEFTLVRFRVPQFSSFTPLGGEPPVGIDSETGLISGVPIILGEHVMAICASEYRDGVLLSTIRRDFQFIVSSCEKAVDARIASTRTLGENEFEVVSCGDFSVQFTNQSVRAQDIKTYAWEFDLGESVINSTSRDPMITFPGPGIYTAQMIVNPGIPNCTDSAYLTVKVFPDLEADFDFTFDTCVAGPVFFTDLSSTDADFITNRRWRFGDGNSLDALNPQHTYRIPDNFNVRLEIEDNNGCIDTEERIVHYAPSPNTVVVEPSVFLGCEPAEVFFNNLSEPINDRYKVVWDFGDGSEGDDRFELAPTHIYEEDGVYNISVDITSPAGCSIDRSFNSLIRVQKGPDADFAFSPEKPNIYQSDVNFINRTSGATGYFWDFAGEAISFDLHPSHEFRDTGLHRVFLQATSSNGCIDTISKIVDVIPLADIFFPNAFTPDGNGRNEEFKGVGNVILTNDYDLTIFDRWGKIVFATQDPTEGWNGKLNNTGEDAPNGVYMYLASYKVPRGEERETRGFATLIR